MEHGRFPKKHMANVRRLNRLIWNYPVRNRTRSSGEWVKRLRTASTDATSRAAILPLQYLADPYFKTSNPAISTATLLF